MIGFREDVQDFVNFVWVGVYEVEIVVIFIVEVSDVIYGVDYEIYWYDVQVFVFDVNGGNLLWQCVVDFLDYFEEVIWIVDFVYFISF